ncbi:hypothetical protein ASZ90_007247 [hydrocarbon metagenome]|uniref:Uncharacterized protein n=1 Tax=hydrocarbon metagenome TaxID=938273 RepID=A0A0W8FQE5_9ZZZZ
MLRLAKNAINSKIAKNKEVNTMPFPAVVKRRVEEAIH